MSLRNAKSWEEARDIASGKRGHADAFGEDLASKVAKRAGNGAAYGAVDRSNPFPKSLACPKACGTKKLFKGLYCPTLTALGADGAVDVSGIMDYAKFLVDDGTNGVFVGGTAGMSMSLSTQERKNLLEAWVAASKKYPTLEVIAHIGAQSVEESRDLAAHAESIGVAGISAMTPVFFKPSTVELLAEFIAHIAAAAPRTPFLYYHFPDITGVAFPMKQVMAALHPLVPTLRGAKFTSTHMWDLGDCIDLGKSLGTDWDLMMGFDGQTLSTLPMGITSHIGISCNGMTPTWNRMIRAYERGDMKAAAREQEIGRKWFAMFAGEVGLWNMGHACKIMLAERMGYKHDFGATKPPQKVIPDNEIANLKKAWANFKKEWGGAKLFEHEGLL